MILKGNINKQYKHFTLIKIVSMSFISKELSLSWEKRDFNNSINKTIEPDKKVSDVIYEMLGEISILLDVNGYKITNKKQFKHELSLYIYSDSVKK